MKKYIDNIHDDNYNEPRFKEVNRFTNGYFL